MLVSAIEASSPDRSVADRFVYTEKVGGSKPSRDIDMNTFVQIPLVIHLSPTTTSLSTSFYS